MTPETACLGLFWSPEKLYPWFVGGNVFIPALLTDNAVLYKPSEYAAMTGLAIARLLHAAGVPNDVFATLIDGLFFTGSHATGAKLTRAAFTRTAVTASARACPGAAMVIQVWG